MLPLADPAPSSRWISSMKRIGFGSCVASRTTASKRSSNSPVAARL
jgi:hypothetical protein